ncbi:MAG: hypothetical protein ACYTBJ_14575 [Planctomycetota bacterium]|jgi:hypothetical protein
MKGIPTVEYAMNKGRILLILFVISALAAFLTSQPLVGFLLAVVVPDAVKTVVYRPEESFRFQLRFGVMYCLLIWTGLVFWCTLSRNWNRKLSLVVSMIVTAAGLASSLYLLSVLLMRHAQISRQITGLVPAMVDLSKVHLELVPTVGVVLILCSYLLAKRR